MFCWRKFDSKQEKTNNNQQKKNKVKESLAAQVAQFYQQPSTKNLKNKKKVKSKSEEELTKKQSQSLLSKSNGNGRIASNGTANANGHGFGPNINGISTANGNGFKTYAESEVETEAERELATDNFSTEEWQFKSLWGKDVTDWVRNHANNSDGINSPTYWDRHKRSGGGKYVFKLFDFDLEHKFHRTLAKMQQTIENLEMENGSIGGGTVDTVVDLESSVGDLVNVKLISSPSRPQLPVIPTSPQSEIGIENNDQFDDHVFEDLLGSESEAKTQSETRTEAIIGEEQGANEAQVSTIQFSSQSDQTLKAKDNNDIVLADLRRIHEEDVQKIESNYRDEIDIMKFRHEENMNDLRRLKEEDAKRLEVKYRVEIDALKLRHVELMVDLKGNREENTKRLEINFREELKVMKIQHEDRMEDLRRTHEEHMETLKRSHDDDMQRLEANYQGEIDSIKFQHEDHISELKRIHELDMQRLESNYRGEIEIMKLRHEEHMADQIRKTPGDILHKEIHSLQVVVEIRNQEIKDLRHDLLEAQSKIENLTQTNEQNRALSAKVEDLEAQLAKTRRDKNKILEKFNTMETSMSQVVIENDRLHLYTEELNWRIETLKSDVDHVPKSMSKSAIEFGTSYSSD